MSQAGKFAPGSSPLAPVVQLTPDNGNPVTADAAQNIDVFGGQGANGAINIQTDGNPIGAIPLHELDIRLTDSILLPDTNAAATQGVIAFGATSYTTDRFLHKYGAASNIFLGRGAGNFTLTGAFNTIGGNLSGQSLTSGAANTSWGYNSLASNTSGQNNIAIGYHAMRLNTTGAACTAIGVNALEFHQSGNSNIALGDNALFGLLTGRSNVAIGNNSGFNYTGAEQFNIIIGPGNFGTVGDNSVIRIGTTGGATPQTSCFIAGIAGVVVGNQLNVVIDSTNGQLGTAAFPAYATQFDGNVGSAIPAANILNIIGGTGVTTSAAGNTVTINASVAPVSWSVITLDQTALVNKGYFCNKAGTLALALPALSIVGDIIEVANINTATGTQFTQAAGQQIFIGNTNTTLGAGGTLTSSAVGDSLRLVCGVANTFWYAVSMIGNWSVV